ncbi:CD163 molecule [Chelydra serpentina]|uniref:CD163 molecule n=1 Tax=Chelydra serpentina TaxID=8475 RepID=A0A8T1RUY0_CHESE|nr:CD163 molecule [Chelydra serpentina]
MFCSTVSPMKHAEVVCKHLGCGSAVSVHSAAHFGEDSTPYLVIGDVCHGSESTIWACGLVTRNMKSTCSHPFHSGVTCSAPFSPGLTGFRLVNGSTACSGRVEIQVLGDWGTVCDSQWDLSDANVLCHQLDCGFAVSVPGGGYFGKGTGSVWRDTFHCKGTEPHLGYCPVTALGASLCSQTMMPV